MNTGQDHQVWRWQSLDVLRGLALAAMIVYHFTWDLSFFRYIGAGMATSTGWALFAKSIAACFLFLSGVSFALATRKSLHLKSFLRRLGQITAAALGVSLATAYAMPHAPVLFGILHCIAAAGALLLQFRRAPWAALGAAVIIFLLPHFLTSQRFDGDGFAWLGLNITPLSAVDHVPLLPWAGWAFLGFGLMRIFLERGQPGSGLEPMAIRKSAHPLVRGLAFSGRHSLAVYLLHQPILLGALWLFAPAVDAEREFRVSCTASCRTGPADELYCTRYCSCMAQEMRQRPLWKNALANTLTPDELREATALSNQCQRDGAR